MASSRVVPAKFLSALLSVAVAALTVQCGGDGGGVTPPTEPAIGLSSASVSFNGTAGGAAPTPQVIEVTNSGGGTLDGLSTTISYAAGQATGWLSSSLSATTAPSTLILTVTPGSLAEATYTANVAVTSATAGNSPQTVTVTFTVAPSAGGAPLIALSSSTQNFAAPQGGADPAAQAVEVTNGGDGTLDALSVSVSYTTGQPTGWLSATLSAPAAPSTLTLTAATGSLTAGTYTASVAVTSPAAGNSPQPVAVTFTVAPPAAAPLIALATTTISFAGTLGVTDPAPQTVAITNGGTGSLTGLAASITYTAGQPTGWLSATLDRTRAPSMLTLAATTGSLVAGTYTATVNVTSPVASNSPQMVAVTFVVTAPPPPVIVLSNTSLTFVGVQSTDPPAQTVEITNGVVGPLTGLEVAVSYTPGQQTDWLFAILSSTEAPSTLTLTPMMASLGEGTYTATVTVSSPVATNSPQQLTVTFTVATSGAPLLEYPFEQGVIENRGVLPGFPNGTTQGNVTFPGDLNEVKFGFTSMKFGGGTSYAVLPGTSAVFTRSAAWSIGLWFKENALEAQNSLFSIRSSPGRGWETYHGVNANLMTTCSDAGCVSFSSPAAGVWHHLLYRYDGVGAPVEIYLDNVFVGSIANSASLSLLGEGVADIRLGATFAGSTFYVDELTVHDAVFTLQQQCVYIIHGEWNGTSCVLP